MTAAATAGPAAGPLADVRVIELAGIGPAPFCSMLLADLGADVVRIDRTESSGLGVDVAPERDLLNRNKRSIALDLKAATDKRLALDLIGRADILIEGFRPGVAERLGLGPDACWGENRALVYGRMTGWGQDGPLANAAGHDLNYIALTGALHCIGSAGQPPMPPLNLIGDFGGGALYLAFGVVSALLEARQSGQGQVVDAAMVDGVASLMTMFHGFRQLGLWSDRRAANIVDGGAPFYAAYETADGKYVSLAAVEEKFFRVFGAKVGLDDHDMKAHGDSAAWPALRRRLTDLFRTRTRDEWCALLEGSDACFAPVLDMGEAVDHPHSAARTMYQSFDGLVQPRPAPRFSRTPGRLRRPPPRPGAQRDAILRDWLSTNPISGAPMPRQGNDN